MVTVAGAFHQIAFQNKETTHAIMSFIEDKTTNNAWLLLLAIELKLNMS